MVFGFDDILIGAAIAGTVTSVIGGIVEAGAEEEAQRRKQQLANEQADEMLARQAINDQLMREKGEMYESAYMASFADTGREGAGIGGALRIKRDIERQIVLGNRETRFKADMLRRGAQMGVDQAGDNATAAYITGAGRILSTGADIYRITRPSTSTRSLPRDAPEAVPGDPRGYILA